MSIDLDDEILQDFLVEAGEIIELLSEQLVDLEQNPQDSELLNAVFRGFHTVKGGAGFLALDALVTVCHKAEDVFNLLRNGERVVDAATMDVVLRALDSVTLMFKDITNGQDPTEADPELLNQLTALQNGEDSITETAQAVENSGDAPSMDDIPATASSTVDEMSDAEYEVLLDSLDDKKSTVAVTKDAGVSNKSNEAGSDEINEEEFEALLDQLHGKGGAPIPGEKPAAPEIKVEVIQSDDISESEFENLLDNLHGKGKAPQTDQSKPPAASDSSSTPPAEKSKASAQPVSKASKKPDAKVQSERVPAAAVSAAKAETTVRVDTSRLDDIMNMVGELVLARNRLMTLRSNFEDEKILHAIANLDLVTADLQGAVMKTRMQPIKKVFGRFPRVVRDLSRSLNKQVDLVMIGEETDLDKNLVDALADPLVHLVRNSVDHGVEMPADRERAGKTPNGTITLSAEQAGDHILLMIRDDGAGIDAEKLRSMAVKKGFMDEEKAARLSEKECFELIFLPGSSTKQEISDISGRGVGMDVVKTRISQLNGQVDIDSKLGEGTTLSIRVPLTLAIMPTLMVVVNQRKFALPLSIIQEIFELDSKKTNIVDGHTVIQVRGKAPTLFYLSDWLLPSEEKTERVDDAQVIMAQLGNRSVGFVVDQVLGQEEVVIKPLGAFLQGLPGLSGATITGDGNIALILDIPSLLKQHTQQRGLEKSA